MALACGNEVGQILLEVLNLGIGMVANVQTKEVATAQPLAPYAFICHTAAWPLRPWHFQQLTSHVGTAAWPLSPRQFQQLTSHAGKLSIAAAWTLAPQKFQQLTSRAGKLSTAAVWTLTESTSFLHPFIIMCYIRACKRPCLCACMRLCMCLHVHRGPCPPRIVLKNIYIPEIAI